MFARQHYILSLTTFALERRSFASPLCCCSQVKGVAAAVFAFQESTFLSISGFTRIFLSYGLVVYIAIKCLNRPEKECCDREKFKKSSTNFLLFFFGIIEPNLKCL